jgi:hypothetical protein
LGSQLALLNETSDVPQFGAAGVVYEVNYSDVVFADANPFPRQLGEP